MNAPWHAQLLQAREYAQTARNKEFLLLCQQVSDTYPNTPEALLNIGALLFDFGFLSHAAHCFEHANVLVPNDQRANINLANLEREIGEHAKSRNRYERLLQTLPNNAIVRRNALVSQQYDPSVSDNECMHSAKAWGEWAIERAGGYRIRPAVPPLTDRPLRIGYISADLCQHTVGLFVKDVIKQHTQNKVTAYTYSAGQVHDWVTEKIKANTQYHDVSKLDDAQLAERIRQDKIDVLIDLSGHTAGSRLAVFAHRPAPVMVSWLGYFATTGLSYLDGILMDEWHAPKGTDGLFIEPVIRLPGGRLCYQPVPWVEDVLPSPHLKNGYLTFGCFNNTSKFNPVVFDLWARILEQAPSARLVLKWRTFNDEALQQKVKANFQQQGVDPERIELRGPSFHTDLLKEYGDIDIALDPFPFTGGLTSCESLYMGVPVVTYPQSRAVSRQTYACLSAIGLPELAGHTADDYVRIALELANDTNRLSELRRTLRPMMRASSLMDAQGFTMLLEHALIDLYQNIYKQQSEPSTNRRHKP